MATYVFQVLVSRGVITVRIEASGYAAAESVVLGFIPMAVSLIGTKSNARNGRSWQLHRMKVDDWCVGRTLFEN